MHTFQGIAIDAGASIDGDCAITHRVGQDCVEIDFGHRTGGLNLCLTEDAAAKLANVITVALGDLHHRRDTTDRTDSAPNDR